MKTYFEVPVKAIEKMRAHLVKLGIPKTLAMMDFKKHPAILCNAGLLKDYCRNPNRNLFLNGPCGTGKTVTTIFIIGGYLLLRGGAYPEKIEEQPRYFNSEMLYGRWVDSSRDGTLSDFTSVLVDCGLLVLDDMGQGDISDSHKRWLYSIINRRVESERPVVATTNLSGKDFISIFGEAIVSRLCSGVILTMKGHDHRLGKA
jgi:DNA replication protein DnaC